MPGPLRCGARAGVRTLFLAGDFDGAYYYINQAAQQDELIGRKSFPAILIGNHGLSKQIVIDPLVSDLCPKLAADYAAITGAKLDATELSSLLEWLAKRHADAFTTVTALHRLRRSLEREANEAVRLATIRSLADLLVALESSLRRKQATAAGVSGQLNSRLTHEVKANSKVKLAYNGLEKWFFPSPPLPTRYTPQEVESEVGVNGLVGEAVLRFGAATSVAECSGIALYAAYRLRNSILHFNEEGLNIYKDRELGLRMAGWVLAACRLIKHSEEGTFAGL